MTLFLIIADETACSHNAPGNSGNEKHNFNPILHGGWIPPLLTLVLNSVSGIQAIVLMFGDFP